VNRREAADGGRPGGDRKTAAYLFAAAFLFYCVGIGWGLPNGSGTWAADAIKPGAPLSILYRAFVSDPGNSGWFWFKYPLGHVFVLGAAYAPYMAWLFLTGAISHPTSTFPYGMSNPEHTLYVLALLGRLVSAAMAAGTVTLAYFALRGFGRRTALAGAVLTAFCYPLVYYAHTTNVEAPYVFWLMVAFVCAVRLTEPAPTRWAWIFLGVGTAMSIASKELAAGFFLGLPPVIAFVHWKNSRSLESLLRGALLAAVSFTAVFLVANNGVLNPSGLVNRIEFLTHQLPKEVALRYAPYYFPIDLGGYRGLGIETAQLALAARRVVESLGWLAALAAVAGWGIALAKRPAWTALVAVGIAGFYIVGLKAMLSLSLRYVLPVSVMGSMLVAVAVGRLFDVSVRGYRTYPLGILAIAVTILYGLDVTRMLVFDSRYPAEAWLRQHAAARTVEVYQRATYLPRFPSSIHVDHVPLSERDTNGLEERSPDFVLLSSAGSGGVSVRYRTDWNLHAEPPEPAEWIASPPSTTGKIMSYHRRRTLAMLAALEQHKVGYHVAARFSLPSWAGDYPIQSLNPDIVIYERDASGTSE